MLWPLTWTVSDGGSQHNCFKEELTKIIPNYHQNTPSCLELWLMLLEIEFSSIEDLDKVAQNEPPPQCTNCLPCLSLNSQYDCFHSFFFSENLQTLIFPSAFPLERKWKTSLTFVAFLHNFKMRGKKAVLLHGSLHILLVDTLLWVLIAKLISAVKQQHYYI